MRHFLAGVSLFALTAAAHAQVTGLPTGVTSIPANAVVYPNCPAPPTSFGNTWTIDPVNGHTPAEYAAMTPPIPMPVAGQPATVVQQGSSVYPWNSFQALFGAKISGNLMPIPGYPTMLLHTAPGWYSGTGPIMPGDEVVLMNGNYGEIGFGGLSNAGSEVINVPAVTVVAGYGQTPVLSTLDMYGTTGWAFKGIKIQSHAAPGDSSPLLEVADAAIAGSRTQHHFREHGHFVRYQSPTGSP